MTLKMTQSLTYTENAEYYKITPTDTGHKLKKLKEKKNQFRIVPLEVTFCTSVTSFTHNLRVPNLHKIWNSHVKYTIWSLGNLGVSTWYGKMAVENWRQTEGTISHRTDNLLNPVLSDYPRWIRCKKAAMIITVLFSSCAQSAFYNLFQTFY